MSFTGELGTDSQGTAALRGKVLRGPGVVGAPFMGFKGRRCLLTKTFNEGGSFFFMTGHVIFLLHKFSPTMLLILTI